MSRLAGFPVWDMLLCVTGVNSGKHC